MRELHSLDADNYPLQLVFDWIQGHLNQRSFSVEILCRERTHLLDGLQRCIDELLFLEEFYCQDFADQLASSRGIQTRPQSSLRSPQPSPRQPKRPPAWETPSEEVAEEPAPPQPKDSLRDQAFRDLMWMTLALVVVAAPALVFAKLIHFAEFLIVCLWIFSVIGVVVGNVFVIVVCVLLQLSWLGFVLTAESPAEARRLIPLLGLNWGYTTLILICRYAVATRGGHLGYTICCSLIGAGIGFVVGLFNPFVLLDHLAPSITRGETEMLWVTLLLAWWGGWSVLGAIRGAYHVTGGTLPEE
jgi:hypothetical protein